MRSLLAVATICLMASSGLASPAATVKARDGLHGVMEVGDPARRSRDFVKTTCGTGRHAFIDCSATDRAGREYAFDDGVLIKLSLNARGARRPVRLPGGLQFGEDIDKAAEKLGRTLGVHMSRGEWPTGEIVYAAEEDVLSKSGKGYGVSLVSDRDGRLFQISESITVI